MPVMASLFLECRCTLGEGIVWWPERRALLWTDIEERRLWVHDEHGTRNWTVPDRLGSLAPCESGDILLALAKGVFITAGDIGSRDQLSLRPLAAVEPNLESTRVNDGRTDREGNFVFGTMDVRDGHPSTGSFYQFSVLHGLRRLDLPHVGIANSICFSPDGALMYFCDSPQRRIMRGRYHASEARVDDVQSFVTVRDGFPDGSVVDADGYLWNAVWGAGVIRRYAPDGSLDREIAVPAKNPTCVTFGGDTMNELYVTTSRQEMSDEELARTADAGSVYRVVVPGVRGLSDRLCRAG
jgi:sugar lactone lactonase YvrE